MDVLNLLGAGSAYSAQNVTNGLLEQAGRGFSAAEIEIETGFTARSSVLDPEYIRRTGNAEVMEALGAATASSNDLGFQASKMALERAGITAEAIGLVIGESSTPVETTPSEAQRIASKLDLRCPAYDVVTGCSAFALHMQALLSWRPETLPDYVLCVYVNTPTTRVDYREGKAGWYVGDAAAAVVVSTRHEAPLKVHDALAIIEPAYSDAAVFETLGHFRMRPDFLSEFVEPKADEMYRQAIQKHNIPSSSLRCAPVQFTARMPLEFAQRHSLTSDRVLRNTTPHGYSFSSSPVSVIADNWNSFRGGDRIVVLTAGCGFSYGYVYLTA